MLERDTSNENRKASVGKRKQRSVGWRIGLWRVGLNCKSVDQSRYSRELMMWTLGQKLSQQRNQPVPDVFEEKQQPWGLKSRAVEDQR